jgi:hypothetical protein
MEPRTGSRRRIRRWGRLLKWGPIGRGDRSADPHDIVDAFDGEGRFVDRVRHRGGRRFRNLLRRLFLCRTPPLPRLRQGSGNEGADRFGQFIVSQGIVHNAMEGIPGASGIAEEKKTDGPSLQISGETGCDKLPGQFAQPFLDKEKERPPSRDSRKGSIDSAGNPDRNPGQRLRSFKKLDEPLPVCQNNTVNHTRSEIF